MWVEILRIQLQIKVRKNLQKLCVRRVRRTMWTGTRSLWKGEDTGTQMTPGNFTSMSVGGQSTTAKPKTNHFGKERIQGPG